MMRTCVLVVLVLCALGVASAEEPHLLKWGKVGHQLTGQIADNLLSPAARARVSEILAADGGQLGNVAAWADDMRDNPQYQWFKPLHFVNTDAWACNYVPAKDCPSKNGKPGVCCDGAIQNYTKQLADPLLKREQHAFALKLLTHFVGDIHQPLHLGFRQDYGGNKQKGTFLGRKTSLHSVWDTKIIMNRIYEDFAGSQSAYGNYLTTLIQNSWSGLAGLWRTCLHPHPHAACSYDWAQETVRLACEYAYVDVDGHTHIQNGFDLGVDYYTKNLPVVEMTLARSAVRLANVLNRLFA